MGSERLFAGTLTVLEKAMDLRTMKHNLIISNIANKDTPNYKAFDLMVDEEMAKAEGSAGATQLKRTNHAHLAGSEGSGSINGTSLRLEETPTAMRGDGNTVDIDNEMAKLSENNLLYDALAQIVSRKFKGLEDAIKGGT